MRQACAWLAIVAWAAVPGAAQIARPQLGYVLDSDGALRPVMGIAAAAALGDPAAENVSSFACSAKFCLVKTDAALAGFFPGAATAQTVAAPAGPALIAIDRSESGAAWVYFPSTQQMVRWQEGVLASVDFAPDGQILSVRAARGGFDYAVARDPAQISAANTWMEHFSASDGSVTVIGPAISDAAEDASHVPALMLADGGVLAALADQIVLIRGDGQELSFPLAGARAFYASGKGYVEVIAPSGMWILRTDPGQEELSMLPGTLGFARPGRENPAREKNP